MRLLLVTSNYPRWAGDSTTPFVLKLAQDLNRLGCAVDVLAPHAPGAARREVLEGIPVERFRYLWPESLQTVCYGGGALVNLRKARSNVVKLPALVAAEWAAVFGRLLRRRYDLLHSHWVLPQGFVGALAARPLGVPHVITVHGGDVFGLRGRGMRRLQRVAFGAAGAVTVNSSATGAAVTSIAPRIAPPRRIPMGVDIAPADDPALTADIRARWRRGAGPLVVFVGRLVEEKGVGDLLQAMALLCREVPDATALVIGEGQDRAAFEAMAGRLGLGERVAFTGWVAPATVGAWMQAADAFVGPSKRGPDGWVEAQGLTFAEALVNGVPVVATRSGGIPDLVRHEETGLLVPEADPAAIAAAVLRLWRTPDLAARLAGAGQAMVREALSREASAAAFLQVFTEVVEARRRGGRRDRSHASGRPSAPADRAA